MAQLFTSIALVCKKTTVLVHFFFLPFLLFEHCSVFSKDHNYLFLSEDHCSSALFLICRVVLLVYIFSLEFSYCCQNFECIIIMIGTTDGRHNDVRIILHGT